MNEVQPSDELNISLEPHLVDSLRSLQVLMSSDIANNLRPYITSTSTPTPTIPYSVLRSVSQWAQKNVESLRSQSPPLDPNAYSMVALLAGTMTSPERNFGAYQQPQDPEEIAAVKIAERKSITAIFNGLLSIFGVGFAVWWAADKLGWKNEWKVLLALFAAIVVAIAEAALYLIWQSRLERSKSKRTKPRHQIRRRPKKDDHPTEGPEPSSNNQHKTISTSVEEVTDAGLRRRQ